MAIKGILLFSGCQYSRNSTDGGGVKKRLTRSVRRKDSRLLGLFDVALELGISIPTARRYALNGLLPFVRIAGRILVPKGAVARIRRQGIAR
jgi:hypothetical protein